MTPVQILESFKDHLDARDNFWTNEQIWRRLDDAQKELIRLIANVDPTFWVATYQFSTVADQATYDLPLHARLGTRFLFAENTSTDQGGEVQWDDLRGYLATKGVTVITNTWDITLEGSKVRVLPTPTAATTDAIKMWFVPSFGSMVQGAIDYYSGTSLTLFSTPNWTTNYGWVDQRDDFYNEMELEILTGDGAGQTAKIADYDGGNRTVTLESAFATAPAINDKFCIHCPIPADFHSLVALNAAKSGAIKNRNRLRELQAVYDGSPGRPGALSDLLTWVEDRQYASPTVIGPNLETGCY